MCHLPADLDGGSVRPDGVLIDRDGQPTSLQVTPGGYVIVDSFGQAVGTLTMVGRIYDGAGQLVAQVDRYDLERQERSVGAPDARDGPWLLTLSAKLPAPTTPQRRR